MDKARNTRTYSHHPRQQLRKSNQMSELFDKVALTSQPRTAQDQERDDKAPNQVLASMENKDSLLQERRKRVHTKMENQTQTKRSLYSQTGWQEPQDSRESSPGLFKDKFEISRSPKKTKTNLQRKKQGKQKTKTGDRKGKTRPKMTVSDSLFTPDPKSPAPKYSRNTGHATDDAGAVERGSCETEKFPVEIFRCNPVAHAAEWTLAHKEPEVKRLSSLSLSSISYDMSSSGSMPSSHPALQPWMPAGVLKRSFVKIKTPDRKELKPVSLDVLSGDHNKVQKDGKRSDGSPPVTDSGSYTTVYTWTSAAGTATNTATQTENKQLCQTVMGNNLSSPSLVLKSYEKDQLHSTAIFPHNDCGHLNQAPQISPIRETQDAAEAMMANHTPAAATVKISPRGPRKMRSFSTGLRRRAHPKCSTMLFTSSVADAGDAPLDISSIREALSEAMDLNEDNMTDQMKAIPHEAIRNRQLEKCAAILTSTPRGQDFRKFSLNLSSVHEAQYADELLPLQLSGKFVNSQEIAADTSSIQPLHESMPGDKDLKDNQEDSKVAEDDEEESGIIMNSLISTPKTIKNFPTDRDTSRTPGQAAAQDKDHLLRLSRKSPLRDELHSNKQDNRKHNLYLKSGDAESCASDDAVRSAGGIIPSGDDFQMGEDKVSSEGETDRKRTSLKKKLELHERGHSLQLEKDKAHARKETDEFCRLGILMEDTYEPCPLSTLGTKGGFIPSQGMRQRRTTWLSSPGDSGFLDIQDVPPDDITVLSLRARKQRERLEN